MDSAKLLCHEQHCRYRDKQDTVTVFVHVHGFASRSYSQGTKTAEVEPHTLVVEIDPLLFTLHLPHIAEATFRSIYQIAINCVYIALLASTVVPRCFNFLVIHSRANPI